MTKCPNCHHELKIIEGKVKMAIQLTDDKGRCNRCGLASCNNNPCKVFVKGDETGGKG